MQSTGRRQPNLGLAYVLPIAAAGSQARALSGYLRRLSRTVAEVIAVDGFPPDVFAAHARAWGPHVRHPSCEEQV